MKKEYPPIDQLKAEFGAHKEIPPEYEDPVLKALSHYPELKEVQIAFRKVKKNTVPYNTLPAVSGLLRRGSKRKYVVNLLEDAEPPVRMALFKNLPEEAKRAVIGHELGHVLQYMKCSTPELLKVAVTHGSLHARRELERSADIAAIEHGLGFELYVHAVYIRRIPGYVEQRKEIETSYLKPQEILDTLPEDSPTV